MLDIFSTNPAFSVTSMTLALNRQPFVPGRIGAMGLYTPKRLTTTSTTIEIKAGRLAFVPSTPRGAPPALNVEDRRELVPFLIPHFPLSDTLLADSIQNIRAFGTEDQLEAINSVLDERLASMGRKHDVTLEYLRLGGVKGRIITRVNRDTGAPEAAIDLRTAFGLGPKLSPGGPTAVPYDLSWPIQPPAGGWDYTSGQDVAFAGDFTQLTLDIARLISDRLGAGSFTGIHGVVGRNFFDAVAKHPEVRTTYLNQPSADRLRDPLWRNTLQFREVTMEEYRGQVGDVRFVEDNYGYFFPTGVPDLFVEAYAPADYMETVNTVALPRYAKQEVLPFNKGVMIETQQNVLPICTQPDVLITVRAVPFV
jgi:Phage major capsid protein E